MMNHPIMNEDNWDHGDLHYQIYNGEFGFDVNGNGDYTWQKWQVRDMIPGQWYYVTAIYSCADHRYALHVSTPALADPPLEWNKDTRNDQNALQTVSTEEYAPEGFCGLGAPVGSCAEQAAAAKWPMITFDSPRIGAWWHESEAVGASYGSQIERALDGEIYEFKVFSYQKNQCHHCTHCYGAGTPGLELSYTFSNDHDSHVPDLSGNGRDGHAFCDSLDQSTCNGLPTERPEHVTCTVPGFGGYFDGEEDYVSLPKLTRTDDPASATYSEIQIDVWAKFHCNTGEHPIMNEDGWNTGDLHYQIYDSEFGFDINGNGDYKFMWKPPVDEWVYISVFYSSEQQTYKLWASVGDSPMVTEVYDADKNVEEHGVGFVQGEETGWVPVVLDSPRLGGWQNPDGEVERSMDGQMSVFRVWSAEMGGDDSCPCQHAQELEAFYVFGESNKLLRDLSGNRHDGTIVGGKYAEDEPLSECVKELRGLAKDSRLTEHCMETDGWLSAGKVATLVPVFALLGVIFYGGKRYMDQRVPGSGKGGDGLTASIFEMDGGVGGGGAAAPYVPPAATTSTSGASGGGGTIYD